MDGFYFFFFFIVGIEEIRRSVSYNTVSYNNGN